MCNNAPPSDRVRRYLLGLLCEEGRVAFEEWFFRDDSPAEELLIAEEELVEDYVVGHLAAEERNRFETHFLTSPRRKEILAFNRALFAKRPRDHAWPTALATAAALAVLAVGGWLLTRESPLPWETSGPVARSPGQEIRLLLGAVATRSGGTIPRARIGPQVEHIVLDVPLDPGADFPTYSAVIETVEGRSITTTPPLPAPPARGTGLQIAIPVAKLPPGDYLLQLRGHRPRKPPEPLRAHAFRIVGP